MREPAASTTGQPTVLPVADACELLKIFYRQAASRTSTGLQGAVSVGVRERGHITWWNGEFGRLPNGMVHGFSDKPLANASCSVVFHEAEALGILSGEAVTIDSQRAQGDIGFFQQFLRSFLQQKNALSIRF